MSRSIPIFLVIAVLLTGCVSMGRRSVDPMGGYQPNSPVDMLQSLKKLQGKSAQIKEFSISGSPTERLANCSLIGPVTLLPPPGVTFPEYVRNALADELSVVHAASTTAETSISGHVRELTLTDGGGDVCVWKIGLTLRSSNGRDLDIDQAIQIKKTPAVSPDQVIYLFRGALMLAMKKTITHPDFSLLFN